MIRSIFVLAVLVMVQCAKAQDIAADFPTRLAKAAESLEDTTVVYSSGYVVIPYPNGDISPKRGACTDLIIKAFRMCGIDLQRTIVEYERNVLHKEKTDTNIDHRRTGTQKQYFEWLSKDKGLMYKTKGQPERGSVVFFDRGKGRYHVAIYLGEGKYIHNNGRGQRIEEFTQEVLARMRYIFYLRK